MPRSLLEVGRSDVVNSKGRRIGRVGDVLFHPDRSEVVGFVVERPRLFMLLDRRDRYLARDRTRVSGRELVVADDKGAWDAAAAKRLGLDWDRSVIWIGMPARTQSGVSVGKVRDGLYEHDSGELVGIGFTGGLVADIAVGTRDLPSSVVKRFDGETVIVDDSVAAIETDGGAAAAAGRQAAAAKQAAGEAGKIAVDAATTAAAAGIKAARAAANTEAGKKTIGWLKALKDEVVDAMGDPDDEK